MAILDYITEGLQSIKTGGEELYQKYASPSTQKSAEESTLKKIIAKGPYYTVSAVNEGFDEVDKLLGTTAHSIMRSVASGKPQIVKGRFTTDVGEAFAQVAGESGRFPGELIGGLFLPPFGLGVTRGTRTLTRIERELMKGEQTIKFAEDVAKLDKVEDIAKAASETFPGVSKQLAEDLGTRYAKVTDATKIGEDLTKIVDSGRISPSQYGETLSKAFPEIAPVEGQHLIKSDVDLYAEVQKIMDEGIEAAERAARTRLDDVGVVTGQELIRKYINEAEALVLKNGKDAGNVFYDKAIDVAQKSVANLTEGGRFLRAAGLIAELSPEGVLRMATKEIERFNTKLPAGSARQLPSLTAEQAQKFSNEMRRIQRIENPLQRAKAIQKLQEGISALVPSSTISKVVTLWKAGLLTGLKTSGLNIASNFSHFVSEVIKDAPATLVDSIASLFTGKRTKSFSIRGVPKGVKDGVERGFDYLKTGFDERNIAGKLDYKKVHFGKSPYAKTLQAYEETVFRIIGAEDQPFYYGAKARSLYDQAIAQTKNEGLRGKARVERVEEFVKKPTDDMLQNSVMDAQVAVFANETQLAKVGRAVQRSFGGGGEFLVPFSRTPAAVAMQLFNYSPAGFVRAIVEQIHKGKFDQRMFAQTTGRAITGTAVLYLGSELYKQGRIALGYPTSEKEKKQWELEGKTRNSIKIGEEWRSASVLGPAGLAMIVGGYMKAGLEETGSYFEATVSAIAGAGKSLIDQTFLKGLSSAMDALQDPSRFGEQFVNNFVGSIVPTIVADVARATDPEERRAETAGQVLQSRIPLWRRNLEPQVNVLGEKKQTQDFLTVMADPTRPAVRSASPVVNELERLWGVGERPTPTQLGDKKGFKVLDQDQNTRLWVYAGDLLHGKLYNLFKTEQYQQLPDDKKADTIASFTKMAYNEARAQMVLALTKDLSGTDLIEELARLKDGKLLTKDAFTRYQQLRASGR